jgi:choline dehydrogenase-like flavoprotein
MIHEIIIVGSGPSGVAAALGFAENGVVPLFLDVGFEGPDVEPIDSNFYDYRKSQDSFKIMIGENYEGLQNVINRKTPSPKISSPYMKFVTKDVERLSPLHETGDPILQSFSMGGLANAWGAGLYRCVDDDFADLPVKASDLSPYYDKLTKEIGISGDNDDLTRFFGSTENLLPPLRLSKKTQRLYSKYIEKKKALNSRGVYIGRPRLGVLSEKYNGREACNYNNLEMWMPNIPYIYTPAYTLKKLIKDNKARYQGSVLVKRWSREGSFLIVHAKDVNNGSEIAFKCKWLVLAAGAINSSKIALNSRNDFNKKLPLIDKSLVQYPLISPSFIGSRFEKDAFALTNLNIIFDLKKYNLRLQGSIIELTSPARSVFYEMFPLAAKDNLKLIQMFLPSVLILFLYFPPTSESAGYLMLRPDGSMEIKSPKGESDRRVNKEVACAFLSLGMFTHPRLARLPTHSLQYAGTLPMTVTPDREYCCSKSGEMYGEPGVYVADGSLFSYIPAKNFSFTLMANAMRITDHISAAMRKQ